jgi:preprotein translocase subunit SecB
MQAMVRVVVHHPCVAHSRLLYSCVPPVSFAQLMQQMMMQQQQQAAVRDSDCVR